MSASGELTDTVKRPGRLVVPLPAGALVALFATGGAVVETDPGLALLGTAAAAAGAAVDVTPGADGTAPALGPAVLDVKLVLTLVSGAIVLLFILMTIFFGNLRTIFFLRIFLRGFFAPFLADDEELLALAHGYGVAAGRPGAPVVFGRLVVDEGLAVVVVGGGAIVVGAAVVGGAAGAVVGAVSFLLSALSAAAAAWRRFLRRPYAPDDPYDPCALYGS